MDAGRMLPAPGQGCLALEGREGDTTVSELAVELTDFAALVALTAERALVARAGRHVRHPGGRPRAAGGRRAGAGRLGGQRPTGPPGSATPRPARPQSRPRWAPGSASGCWPPGRARCWTASVSAVSEGMVYLVGAGPGDPGLMTRRSLELIAQADAILYDRLIPVDAMRGARADAELVFVGKAPGDVAMGQEDINATLVRLGQAGQAGGAPQGRRPVRVRPRRRGGRGAGRRRRAVRGGARRDRRRGRAGLRGHSRDAPRHRRRRRLRDRPRAPRQGRERPGLGGAGAPSRARWCCTWA